MTGRSRTGCLTCRQRKLKCDEQRPICGQCMKASRDCIPSSGIVFRHQQNASMNSGEADDSESLKGFYAYKNTFDKDSTWVNIPKRIKFVVNADPYADFDPDFDETATSNVAQLEALSEYVSASDWSPPNRSGTTTRPHSLEALSAATSDPLNYLPPATTINQSLQREVSAQPSDVLNAVSNSTPHSFVSSPDTAMAASSSSHSHRNPNAHAGMSPPVDPFLDRGTNQITRVAVDVDVEVDHETAFLLRHFAEGPGQWMDLFDLGNFFAHYVPVRAIANPLLKHAAAAYAAKQLSRVRGHKPVMGGATSRQARMEQFPNLSKTDWEYMGAQHYDKAISLLMENLKDDGSRVPNESELSPDQSEFFDQSSSSRGEKRKATHDNTSSRSLPSSTDGMAGGMDRKKKRKPAVGKVKSDEMAAATAILCNYEFLDASGSAWSRHLDGTKSLLDIAEGRMVPLLTPFVMPRPNISKARRATFWNFARQDMLSALINETSQTRLDTEDLPMWKDGGLLLDDNGYVKASNTTETGYPEGVTIMKDDMISNALVWLIGKIINYCVAADTAPTRAGGNPQPWEGINQRTLMEAWTGLSKQLDVWFNGLPDTFKACAEIIPRPSSASGIIAGSSEGSVFSEVWFASPICASTMQSYHMARMLLLINMPQHSTLGRQTTAYARIFQYKSITQETEYHSRAICSIAAGRPDASVRIHSVQPLFLAGQFLDKSAERAEILRMLREIQDDTGWATDYRVKQLLKIWGWEKGDPDDVS